MIHEFGGGQKDDSEPTEAQKIGFEFMFRYHFVGIACDFLLGKKSPMIEAGEKRTEMGGSFSSPNFGSIVKLVTKMITSPILEEYPLHDVEKQMLLYPDLLKVMLGSSNGSKQLLF